MMNQLRGALRVSFVWGMAIIGAPSLWSETNADWDPGLEVGRLFIRSFSPRDFRGHGQSFGAAQDSRGVTYFTNYGAVMEYDGIEWNRILVPDTSFVYGLAIDEDDILYVGALGQLGLVRDFEEKDPDSGLSVELSSQDREDLLSLSRRGDVVGLRRRLKEIADTDSRLAGLVAELDGVAAGYRMGELRGRLQAMEVTDG